MPAGRHRPWFRDGGVPPRISPYAPAGVRWHWGADGGIGLTLGTDQLAQWTDQISGVPAVQAALGAQPLWKKGVGPFTVLFSTDWGGAQYLTIADATLANLFVGGASSFGVGWVAQPLNAATTIAQFSAADAAGNADWWYWGYNSLRATRVAQQNGGFRQVESTTTGLTTPNYAIGVFTSGPDNMEMRVNGISEANAALDRNPDPITRCGIGARVANTVGVFYSGDLLDLFIWDTLPSASQIAMAEAVAARRA